MQKKKIKNVAFILIMLTLVSCGSTHPIMSGGEYHEAGFFLGIFGGLLWPLSLIFMGIGMIFPKISGGTALYYHYNSGFGYWLGYCIGLLPYLALIGAAKQKNKGNDEQK